MSDKPDRSIAVDTIDVRSVIYAARYANQCAPQYSRCASHYAAVIGGRMQIARDAKCLDVACGDGNFLAFYRQIGVRDYIGLDNNADQLHRAANELGESHTAFGDAFLFLERCNKSSFNVISALDFVEHLTKVECLRFLALVSDALAPGGMLLVRTPNAGSPWGMNARYNDLTHEICFTPNAFRDTVRIFGFSRVKVWEDIPIVGDGFSQAVRWAGWQFAHLLLLGFDFLEVGRATDRVFSRNMWALAFKEG